MSRGIGLDYTKRPQKTHPCARQALSTGFIVAKCHLLDSFSSAARFMAEQGTETQTSPLPSRVRAAATAAAICSQPTRTAPQPCLQVGLQSSTRNHARAATGSSHTAGRGRGTQAGLVGERSSHDGQSFTATGPRQKR